MSGSARRLAGFDGDDQRFDQLVDELVDASLVVADTTGPSTRYQMGSLASPTQSPTPDPPRPYPWLPAVAQANR